VQCAVNCRDYIEPLYKQWQADGTRLIKPEADSIQLDDAQPDKEPAPEELQKYTVQIPAEEADKKDAELLAKFFEPGALKVGQHAAWCILA
jgi:hypothetical protein